MKLLRAACITLLLIVLPYSCYAASGLDGNWKVNDHTCVSYNGQSYGCADSYNYATFSGGNVYAGNKYIGSVTQQGNTVVFRYSFDYLKETFEAEFAKLGYTVTVQYASISYTGTLATKKMRIKGTISGRITVLYQGYSIPIDLTGNFTAKKTKRSNSDRPIISKDISSKICDVFVTGISKNP